MSYNQPSTTSLPPPRHNTHKLIILLLNSLRGCSWDTEGKRSKPNNTRDLLSLWLWNMFDVRHVVVHCHGKLCARPFNVLKISWNQFWDVQKDSEDILWLSSPTQEWKKTQILVKLLSTSHIWTLLSVVQEKEGGKMTSILVKSIAIQKYLI